jgi:23S rRNA pseudouridine1911/1915/1917 synthase
MGGMRLDAALAQLVEGVSRARLKTAIEAGQILLDDAVMLTPRHKLIGGERLEVTWEEREALTYIAQDIPLDIVYEDEGLLVINKPAGLVVHPGAGNQDGTLLNALLHYDPSLSSLPRAGIVHRLDKLTSGLLVVAKTLSVQEALTDMLKEHLIERLYDAVALGQLVAGGTVEAAIGRHISDRTKMMVDEHRGRDAVTHYRVMEKFRAHTHVRCQLETGRTHQIRVHLAHLGHPLFGDPDYGRRLSLPRSMAEDASNVLRSFKRQALHAAELAFVHPLTDEEIHCIAPLPEDMQQLLQVLREDSQIHQQEY